MTSKAIVRTNARKETKSVFMAITDIRAAHSRRFNARVIFPVTHLKCVASNTDIALRIWHLDFIFFELIVNGEVELSRELAFSLRSLCVQFTTFSVISFELGMMMSILS